MPYSYDTFRSERSIDTVMDQYSGDSLTQPLLRPNAGEGVTQQMPESKSWRRRAFSIARPYRQACAAVAQIGRLLRPRTTKSQLESEDDDLELSRLPTVPEKNERAVRKFHQALAREEQRQRHREEEERYEQDVDEWDRRFDNNKNSLDLARERLSHSPSSSRTSNSEQSEKGSEKVFRLGT
ncbi:hypothetical protein HII31_06019, partial [Pseudocercospora fuligena]